MLTRDRLGAFIAVLFGTAVVAMTLTLLASASPRVPERYAAVTVAVRSPAVTTPADPFPEPRPWSSAEATALAGRLAAIPGVEAAVADRGFYAQPVRDGKAVGEIQEAHGWASVALAADRLVAGRPATTGREVVIARSLGIPVGGTVTILTATGPTTWTVAGLIDAPRLYVADATAARLAPGVRLIGLLGRPDPAQVRTAAAGSTVLHGASLGDLEPRADARTRWIGMQVLTAMTALSLFACVFVIASTFALTVHQRRREIGLLRTIGATPRQVRRTVLAEAAAVGLGAAVVGVFLGVLLAAPIGRVLVDAGFEPASFSVGLHLWPVLAGMAAGPVVSVAGALAAARRAARIGPLEALREAEVETRPMSRVRWAAGLLFAAAGLAALLATAVTDDLTDLSTFALLGAMALVVAATVLAPAAVPLLVRVLLRPARGPIGMVMRESALTGARRTASTAAPVLLTIAFAVFIAGNVQTSASAYAERRAGAIQAGTVLVPDGTPGLSDAVAGSAPLPTTLYFGDTVAAAAGLDPAAGSGVARDLTAADSVVMAEWLAAQLQLGLGDTIEATFVDGARVPLRISGVAPDGTSPAELVLSRATVREHDPSALAAAVPVTAGVVPAAAIGARVVDVAAYARTADAEEDRLVWIFTMLLIGVSVGYGALAVANTLFMATSRRAPDYRLLRLAGATPRQVLIAIAGESVLVVAIGAVLGTAAATLALWGGTAGLRAQTATNVPLAIPWPTAVIAVVACLLLALAGSVLPARAQLTRTGLQRDER
jgi:putative ABC transport system permease protein